MATYYASQAGVGAADGSSADNAWSIAGIVWATLGAAENTLYLLGTITSTITPTSSGSSNTARITIRGDYTGNEASLESSGFHGIDINGYSNFTITNINNIKPANGRGIYLRNACSNITVTQVKAYGSATSNAIQYIGHGDNILIDNNPELIGGFDSVKFDNDIVGDVTNVTITNNTLPDAGRHAIHIQALATSAFTFDTLVISGNTITGSGSSTVPNWDIGGGIRVGCTSLSSGSRISNVTIDDNNISNAGGIGIYASLCDIIKVTRSDIREVSLNVNGQGIGLYGCTNFLIEDFYIDGVYTNSPTNDGHGIDLDYIDDAILAATTYIDSDGVVCNGTIKNCMGAPRTPGINLLSVTDTRIHGVLIENCVNAFKIGQHGGAGAAVDWENLDICNNSLIGGSGTTAFLVQNITVAKQATHDTNQFNNNIISGWVNGYYAEAGDGDLNNIRNNIFFDNTNDTVHDGTGAINLTDEISATVNPLNGDYTYNTSGDAIGAGYSWVLNIPNPIGRGGEPFSNYDIDIGHYMSTYSPFHPINT